VSGLTIVTADWMSFSRPYSGSLPLRFRVDFFNGFMHSLSTSTISASSDISLLYSI